MKGRLIAIAIATVVAWLADGLIYQYILTMDPDMVAAFGSAMHSEETMPSPAWFLVYEFCRVAIVAMVVFAKPAQAMDGAKAGALAFLWITLASNVFWYMMFTINAISWTLTEVPLQVVVGALVGYLMVMANNKMGGGS